MPLYKPKFLCPNETIGDPAVDINIPFKPTCVIDGNEPINAYKVDIMKLTDDGYVLYVFDEELTCSIAGKLYVPSDKPPIKTNPIYTFYTTHPCVPAKIDDEEGCLVRPKNDEFDYSSGDGEFVVGKTYRVQYTYVVPRTFYSTNKQSINLFYPTSTHGRYNTFELTNGINLNTLPMWYLASDFIECTQDGELELKHDIYSTDSMTIYSVGDYGATDGAIYMLKNNVSDLSFEKNKLSSDIFKNGMLYLVSYKSKGEKSDPFKYKMSFWSVSNTTDSPTVSSDYAVFYANVAPQIKLYSDGVEVVSSVSITKRSCLFTVDYIDEYSSVKWFGWILKNSATGEIIEDTISKNRIYGSAGNISYSYSGFISGQEYELSFKVVSQNDMFAFKTIKINVSYQAAELSGDFLVTQLPNECGMLCNWGGVKVVSGSAFGRNSYIDNYPMNGLASLKLYEQSGVSFQKSDKSNFIVYDSSYILISLQYKGQDSFKNVQLLEFSSSVSESDSGIFTKKLFINDDSKLAMTISRYGTVVAETTSTISFYGEQYWNFVLIKPNGDIREVVYEATGARTPLSNLSPSTNLTPTYGAWQLKADNELVCNVSSQYSLPLNLYYRFLAIGGSGNKTSWICDYICATQDEAIEQIDLSENFISDANDFASVSSFDFFSKFNYNLNAGNTLIESLDEFEIRRKENANPFTEFVADIHSINTSFVVDYMVSNNKSYSYYLYPKSESGIMYPMRSNDVKTQWSHYCLMVADDSGIENVLYLSKMFIFRLNLNIGDMSNNTDIEVIKNFTPYPTVQASPSNYWSGSLSSLVGFVSCGDGKYKQTPQMMTELKSLTTDTRRKFLKDIEGNLFEIQISSELKVSNENNLVDSLRSVSIDWVEVGDTYGLSVINNPNLSVNTWLLTNNGIVSPYLNYVWDDSYLWDDNKYWTGNHGVLDVE